MKRSYASAIALAIATLAAGQVLAADLNVPNAPDQVFADVREAMRTGGIVSHQMRGNKQDEPTAQIQPAAVEGKAPDQIFADVREAMRTGGIISHQMRGNKQDEPTAQIQRAAVEGKAPDQIFAEVREAMHADGIISRQMRRN